MARIHEIKTSDREQLVPLLNIEAASNALATYCALHHPADKLKLYVSSDGGGNPNGFIAIAQTGLDLFRPIAVPFVASSKILGELLRVALRPGQPVLLYLPLEQRDWLIDDLVLTEPRITELLRIDPMSFRPIVNVLVIEVGTPSGLPRYEIRTKSGSMAAAGINWLGERFSEVYLEADHEAQVRGLALSVLSAMNSHLLEENRIPLFRSDDSNKLGYDELLSVGYRATGTRTLIAQVLFKHE
jgi:hypothetical protein